MKLEGVFSVNPGDQVIAPMLASWSKHRPYDGHPPGEIGASQLGKCSRALVYQISSEPVTNPMTESGWHATGIGSLVHQAINEELDNYPPEGWVGDHDLPWSLVVEVPDSDPLLVKSEEDIGRWFREGSDEDGNLVEEVVDIKTMAQFGFISKVTREGPDRGHLLQVGMAMKARVDRAAASGREVQVRGRLVYIVPNELKGTDRLTKDPGEYDYRENRYHEYVWSWEAIESLVQHELYRLVKVRTHMDEGKLVPRTIPGVTQGGVIVGYHEGDRKGIWQRWARDQDGTPVLIKTGKTWHCGYCDWRDLCMAELETETNETNNTEE